MKTVASAVVFEPNTFKGERGGGKGGKTFSSYFKISFQTSTCGETERKGTLDERREMIQLLSCYHQTLSCWLKRSWDNLWSLVIAQQPERPICRGSDRRWRLLTDLRRWTLKFHFRSDVWSEAPLNEAVGGTYSLCGISSSWSAATLPLSANKIVIKNPNKILRSIAVCFIIFSFN